MGEEWIAPLAALVGTILGALIPSSIKMLENKFNRTYLVKDRHEEFTREMLNVFLPKLDTALMWVDVLLDERYSKKQKEESLENIKSRLADVYNHFDLQVQNKYPLKLFKLVDKLRTQLRFIMLYVDYYEAPDVEKIIRKEFQRGKFPRDVRKTKRVIRRIKKQLTKKYI